MPDFRRTTCKNCGKHRDAGGPISWRGLCGDCGLLLCNANADDLHYHEGPGFERWRRAMAASVGGVLVDDLREKA